MPNYRDAYSLRHLGKAAPVQERFKHQLTDLDVTLWNGGYDAPFPIRIGQKLLYRGMEYISVPTKPGDFDPLNMGYKWKRNNA